MHRCLILGLLVCLIPTLASAEAPDIEWQAMYGSSGHDWAHCVIEVESGGFVIAGQYFHMPYGTGDDDFYVVRVDASGHIMWDSTYGGENSDVAGCVVNAADGGFMVCGWENSFFPDGTNIWVVKTDAGGRREWETVYGGIDTATSARSMCKTLDGNYMIAGNDIGGWYFVKIDSDGHILNEVRIDRSLDFHEITPTSDGGAIAIGGGTVMFLAKLDVDGDTLWTRSYGSGYGSSVIQLPDGGYAATGHKSVTLLDDEFWLLRLDENGNKLWDRHYGNQFPDKAYSLRRTFDGGFVMAGLMYPANGTENAQVWVVRTDAIGDTIWTKAFGGTGTDFAFCIQQTSDSGYIVAGKSTSTANDDNDMYVVKLEKDPAMITAADDENQGTLPQFALNQNHPNPFNPETEITFSLTKKSNIRLVVYNLLGEEVATLVDAELGAGEHRVVWDGMTKAGRRAATGVYCYRIEANGIAESKKMLLLK
ncbi:MAG: FlgD immunoglobulin-like domain containing protein [Candidatus Zixiibacteriota bacterium]